MDPNLQCRALNVSDEKRCGEVATSVNGHFCAFHSKQCQGLYRGYKNRNARLDKLSANPPEYLADPKVSLSSRTFEDVDTKELCEEIHAYLFLKFQLLDRVIRARKLHHSRFFSATMDYGHEKYLDILQGQKATITKALERLERRTAEVLYKKEQWFNWVRECQNEEEENREKEQKKVKMEAALFKRHWKATEQRMNAHRAKENKKRQDGFLEKIYKERLAEQEEEDSEMDWDPIEDVLEDTRGDLINLIEHFLWLESPVKDEELPPLVEESAPMPAPVQVATPASTENRTPAKKGKKKKKKAPSAPADATSERTPDKSLIESKEEMAQRLEHGMDYNRDDVVGVMVGTYENPVIETKTVAFQPDEIKKLLQDISEIKKLLFCRLLLGYATLLPAALKANSIEAFLADKEVTPAALRDLCLKLESPGLQEIRDACADLFRTEDEEEEEDTPMSGKDNEEDVEEEHDFRPRKRPGDLPDEWKSKRDKARIAKEERESGGTNFPPLDAHFGAIGSTAIDFGDWDRKLVKYRDPAERRKGKKIRVTLCGRTIWNYPSNKAMTRAGWLQFCIIAKDSRVEDAVELCRHWDEFFELNILACWHYFPGANWVHWIGSRPRQQMLQMGFITYYESHSPDAEQITVHHQSSRHGPQRRNHAMFEARNIMCAHIKRDDPASRRLIQYLAMESHLLLVLVRDGETGKLLVKPPEDERWLTREKSGLGRASKNEWRTLTSIGPVFFEKMDKHRDWHFSFKEYYDVYIWELEPGNPFAHIFNIVQRLLYRALRCRTGLDMYRNESEFLKTLCRPTESHRVRDIRPEDGSMKSIWDEMSHEKTRFFYGEITKDDRQRIRDEYLGVGTETPMPINNLFPRFALYRDTDAAEDKILFPEEDMDPLDIGKPMEPIQSWEAEGYSLNRFVKGMDLVDSDTDSEDGEIISDDGNEEWDDEESEEDEDDDMFDLDGGDDDEIIFEDEDKNDNGPHKPGKSRNMDLMMKLFKQPEDTRDKGDYGRINDEFMRFMDKEKAGIFKQCWHKADLEPHAQNRYSEMLAMAKASRKYASKCLMGLDSLTTFLTLTIMVDMTVPQEDSKDVHKAVAKVAPFFDKGFFDHELGAKFKESLLFKPEERAKTIPYSRTQVSNKMRPADFWKPYDEACKAMQNEENLEALPLEYESTTRPIIAHLYKSGILRTRSHQYFAGQAFSTTEPSRPDVQDFFIDYRIQIPTIKMSPTMVNPYTVTPFKTTAQEYAAKHPDARFSILRLWSSAYFYPLMIGPDSHDGTAFRDTIRRNFIWMFVPKDMPCSEWSIHFAASERIRPFRKLLGKNVVLKRDRYLVMAENEEELCKLTSMAVYAVECRPWRQEVDLWKSFLNVDNEFLQGLDDAWVE